ncbi:hypothetical protein P12x_005980 (plasmid) [Tundrisphaera lichenicola]
MIGSLTITEPWPVDDAIDAPTRRTIDPTASHLCGGAERRG